MCEATICRRREILLTRNKQTKWKHNDDHRKTLLVEKIQVVEYQKDEASPDEA